MRLERAAPPRNYFATIGTLYGENVNILKSTIVRNQAASSKHGIETPLDRQNEW